MSLISHHTKANVVTRQENVESISLPNRKKRKFRVEVGFVEDFLVCQNRPGHSVLFLIIYAVMSKNSFLHHKSISTETRCALADDWQVFEFRTIVTFIYLSCFLLLIP